MCMHRYESKTCTNSLDCEIVTGIDMKRVDLIRGKKIPAHKQMEHLTKLSWWRG